ncbi:MAG: hypothetical protein LBT40_10970 [Deltaproteobacteria bacterium]|jgi:hypothetical protein|nr:hypothetical protein [Deltaproteobacteria bacterium]
MTLTMLEKFAESAAGARAACESRASGPLAMSFPPEQLYEDCHPTLREAADALEALRGGRDIFADPAAYGRGLVDLMKAYAAEGRLGRVEELFHRLPRFPKIPELDDLLCDAARVYAGAALAAGDLTAAEQACSDGFPEMPGFRQAEMRLEAAVMLIVRHLSADDYPRALSFFRPFVPGTHGPSWAPMPLISESPEEARARRRYLRRLAGAAGVLFDHLERHQLFPEMVELYGCLERMDGTDEVLELRLAKAAALVRLAVKTGKLHDGMRFYGTLGLLSYMEGSDELISSSLMLLTEAYRDTGDDTAVQRLINGY